MGYNTTVVVMNDSLEAIEKDPDFGRKLRSAVGLVSSTRGTKGYRVTHGDVSALGNVNAATVIETHNADTTSVVAVGGNTATVLLETGGYYHHERVFQERLVRELANQLGYNLSRKSRHRVR